MATTDINGMVFYAVSDPVEPLQTLFNGISTATTNALNANVRIFKTANATTRAALAASRGASTASPLVVYRQDTQLYEYTVDATNWFLYGASSSRGGQVRAVTTSASGTVAVTHGLGTTPNALVYSANGFGGTDVFTFRTESRNSTMMTVVVYRNGAIATNYTFSAGYGFDWVALA